MFNEIASGLCSGYESKYLSIYSRLQEKLIYWNFLPLLYVFA